MMITKSKLVSYTAVIIIATAQPALAQRDFGGWGNHMGGAWQGWFMGPLVWLLFLVIAVALIVFFVRALTQKSDNLVNQMSDLRANPLGILKERFAKGEIDKKEFDERRQHLGL